MTTHLSRIVKRETDDRYENKVLIVTLDPQNQTISLRPKATSAKRELSISFSKLYAMLNQDPTEDDRTRKDIESIDL